MSDKDGDLQFYTNGCAIYNFDNELMENGDSLNFIDPEPFDYWCNFAEWYPSSKGITGLPWPGKEKRYVIFHTSFLTIEPLEAIIMYSVINMAENNGKGKVIKKNVPLLQGNLNRAISCTRHGKGRDWWVVANRFDTSKVQAILLQPDTILVKQEQSFGNFITSNPSNTLQGQGVATFSPNGEKYVRIGNNRPGKLVVYDFDRCLGVFSNQTVLPVLDTSYQVAYFDFSPNGRFLYLENNVDTLFQYDFSASRTNPPRILIDIYDGFKDPFPATFYGMVSAPDGKIYMTTPNGTKFLHVINSPNELGKACNFEQHSIQLPARKLFDLPHFSNFRLFDAPGSSCDSLSIDDPNPPDQVVEKSRIRFVPNPASDAVEIYIDRPHTKGWIRAYNVLGQKIYEGAFSGASEIVSIPVWDWAAGGYVFDVEQDGTIPWIGKLIVVH